MAAPKPRRQKTLVPLAPGRRHAHYFAQNNAYRLTTRQLRRITHKENAADRRTKLASV